MDRAVAYDAVTRLAVDERRRVAELRAVLEAIGDGLLVAASGGRIFLANDTAVELMGSAPQDLADVAAWLDVPTAELTRGEGASPRTVGLADGRWIDVIVYDVDLDAETGRARAGRR